MATQRHRNPLRRYTSALFGRELKPMSGPTFQDVIQTLNRYWAVMEMP